MLCALIWGCNFTVFSTNIFRDLGSPNPLEQSSFWSFSNLTSVQIAIQISFWWYVWWIRNFFTQEAAKFITFSLLQFFSEWIGKRRYVNILILVSHFDSLECSKHTCIARKASWKSNTYSGKGATLERISKFLPWELRKGKRGDFLTFWQHFKYVYFILFVLQKDWKIAHDLAFISGKWNWL